MRAPGRKKTVEELPAENSTERMDHFRPVVEDVFDKRTKTEA